MSRSYGTQQKNERPKNSIEDLKRLERDIHLATHYMLREVKYEDASIFIGSTRSGKSTLINYLIGNTLIGEKAVKFKPVSIKKLDDPTNMLGPQIGTGPTSDTVFPSRWNSRQPLALTLWDAPGFDDNRGIVQDITNAFYVYELFKNLKSAKIILVTDINDIACDNIRPFLSLLNSVEKILKEKISECFPGIAIIFSKVPNEIAGEKVNKKYINDLLEYQFLSSNSINISEPAKDLIRHLIKNNQKIGFFKQAIIGDITDPVINEGIFEAVESASTISENILKQVSPSIAETSKLFLYEAREQLCSKETFINLQNLLRKIFTASVENFETLNINKVSKDKLSLQLQELAISKSKLSQAIDSTSFDKKIDAIRAIDPSVAKFIDEYNLLQAARLMEFSDRLLDLQESKQFDINLQGLLIAAQSNTNELMINVQLKLAKISQEEAEQQSLQLTQKYNEDREKLISQNEAVANHNAEMMQQFHQQFERIAVSQAEKDKQFMEYFEDIRREQKEIRKREKRERKEAEERERERWRKENERREQERKRDEEERKERARIDRELSMKQSEAKEQSGTHDVEIKFNYGKLLEKFWPPNILGL